MNPIAPKVLDRLRRAALDATANADAPWSQFCAGAPLLFEDGQVVTGRTVENVSCVLTSCAERNAIFPCRFEFTSAAGCTKA